MEITIKVTGLDQLAGAINALAAAMGGMGLDKSGNVNSVQSIQQTQASTQPVQTGTVANVQTPPIQQARGAAVPTAAPPQTTIPTTVVTPGYTQDQLAVAMTGLVDQGRQPELMQILAQFGAQSLMQVPKEQYAALATRLREAGAVI